MSLDSVPRMSAQYIKCMMTFKNHLKPKNLEEGERKKSMPETENQGNFLKRVKRKLLFNKKYEGFVDRIYGKVNRERKNLEGVFNLFRKAHNKKSQTRFLNSEEQKISEAINESKKKQRFNEKLLSKLSNDFVKEAQKQVDQLNKRSLKDIHKLDNGIFDKIVQTFYDKDQTIQSPRKLPSLDASKPNTSRNLNFSTIVGCETLQYSADYYKVLNTTTGNSKMALKTEKEKLLKAFKTKPKHMIQNEQEYQQQLKESLQQVNSILLERKTKERTFQEHINYQKESVLNNIIPDEYYTDSLKRSAMRISLLETQQQSSIVTQSEISEGTRSVFFKLQDECKKEQQFCKKIMHKCSTQKNRFDHQYDNLQGSCNKYIC